jgi:limonene-1,2-epoxide hydrolase
MEQSTTLVRQFFKDWGRTRTEIRNSVLNHVLPDAVWENIGLNTLTGAENIAAFLDSYLERANLATFEAEIINIAASDNTVFVERIDRAIQPDGTTRPGKGVRVVGVFELADGKIARWRDYFDTAPHQKATAR